MNNAIIINVIFPHTFCDVVNEFNVGFGLPKISISEDNNYQKIFDISIKPNPADETITFSMGSTYKGNLTITFYNSIGLIVQVHNMNKNESNSDYQFDISKLTNGMYLYKIQSEDKFINGYFIISK